MAEIKKILLKSFFAILFINVNSAPVGPFSCISLQMSEPTGAPYLKYFKVMLLPYSLFDRKIFFMFSDILICRSDDLTVIYQLFYSVS